MVWLISNLITRGFNSLDPLMHRQSGPRFSSHTMTLHTGRMVVQPGQARPNITRQGVHVKSTADASDGEAGRLEMKCLPSNGGLRMFAVTRLFFETVLPCPPVVLTGPGR